MARKLRCDDEEGDVFLNVREPALGPGVLVRMDSERSTYRFLNGGERSFKNTYCRLYMKPAFNVSKAIRDQLLPPLPAAVTRATRAKAPLPRTKAPAPKATHETFEAAIRERPDDPGPYLVYADWLQLEQDPRGQLITIQAQRAATDSDALAAAEKKLLAKHGAYFVPEALAHALQRRRSSSPRCVVTWRNGFFAHVRLARDGAGDVDLEIIARAVLAHPSARFLRSLKIGQLGTREYSYNAIVRGIAKRGHPMLAELHVGDFTAVDCELASSRAGDIVPLFAALPGLEKLVVNAGHVGILDPIEHAKLRHLSLTTLALNDQYLDHIINANLPALESLAVRMSLVEMAPADLVSMRRNFPKLRRLALPNMIGTGAFVRGLLGSQLLAQLEELDLTGGDLDDKTASEMMGEREQFAHMRLSVGGSKKLSPDWAERLAKATGAHTARPRLPITEETVLRRAPDHASILAARKIAIADQWMALGFDPRRERVWGEYEGRDHYYVYAELRTRAVGCGCGSPKSPCKHALALMLLAANQHAFPDAQMPDVVGRTASPWRPSYSRDDY